MYGTCHEEGEHNPERHSSKIAALSPGEEKLQASSKEEGHVSQPRGFRGIIVTGSQVSPARCAKSQVPCPPYHRPDFGVGVLLWLWL